MLLLCFRGSRQPLCAPPFAGGRLSPTSLACALPSSCFSSLGGSLNGGKVWWDGGCLVSPSGKGTAKVVGAGQGRAGDGALFLSRPDGGEDGWVVPVQALTGHIAIGASVDQACSGDWQEIFPLLIKHSKTLVSFSSC